MNIVTCEVSPRATVRFKEYESNSNNNNNNKQRKESKLMEKRMEKLEEQVKLMSREREDCLDELEEKQRAISSAEVEITNLKEIIRLKVAEVEGLKQRALKEAIHQVKIEWCNKIEEIIKNNTELLYEVQIRDNRITALQESICEYLKKDNKDSKLLDDITSLTAELLHREKLLSEKDSVIYSYETRLERSEKIAHNALETQCKFESRINQMLQERKEHLKLIEDLTSKNQQLEESLEENMSSKYKTEDIMDEDPDKYISPIYEVNNNGENENENELKENKEFLNNPKDKNKNSNNFFIDRLAVIKKQKNIFKIFFIWAYFTLYKKNSHLKNKEQQLITSETTIIMLREALEKGEACVQLTKEVLAEAHVKREATEKELNFQRNKFKQENNKWIQKECEMSEKIKILEQKINETREKLIIKESLPHLYAISEKSSHSSFQNPEIHECITQESIKSNSPVVVQISVHNSPQHNDIIFTNEEITSKTNINEEKDEAMSEAIESLASLQDASEAGVIISNLLSLHRQAVDSWRVKAIASQDKLEKINEEKLNLFSFFKECVIPHLLNLNDMFNENLIEKLYSCFNEYTYVIKSEKENEEENLTKNNNDNFILILKSWNKWQLHVEFSRFITLRNKATSTVTSMAEKHEKLKDIAQRAMNRIKELEKSQKVKIVQ